MWRRPLGGTAQSEDKDRRQNAVLLIIVADKTFGEFGFYSINVETRLSEI